MNCGHRDPQEWKVALFTLFSFYQLGVCFIFSPRCFLKVCLMKWKVFAAVMVTSELSPKFTNMVTCSLDGLRREGGKSIVSISNYTILKDQSDR